MLFKIAISVACVNFSRSKIAIYLASIAALFINVPYVWNEAAVTVCLPAEVELFGHREGDDLHPRFRYDD